MKAVSEDICTLMSVIALFTTTKCWKQSKCPLMDKYMNKCELVIYSMEKKGNCVTCYNMDEP